MAHKRKQVKLPFSQIRIIKLSTFVLHFYQDSWSRHSRRQRTWPAVSETGHLPSSGPKRATAGVVKCCLRCYVLIYTLVLKNSIGPSLFVFSAILILIPLLDTKIFSSISVMRFLDMNCYCVFVILVNSCFVCPVFFLMQCGFFCNLSCTPLVRII